MSTSDSELAALGRLIAEARNAQGLTQGQLAEQAGVGLQTVVRIEQGNAGVGVGHVASVLRCLKLPLHQGVVSAPTLPLHPRHIEDPDVQEVLDQAVQAACEALDRLFPGQPPEVRGVSSNFAGQLRSHMAAMLTGEPGYQATHRVALNKLLYCDADFGPQVRLSAEADGYLAWREGTDEVLEGGRFRVMTKVEDLYTSREAAIEALRKYLAGEGELPGPVRVVPGKFCESKGVQLLG